MAVLNVAYCTDENYSKLMTISIVSLLDNNRNLNELNIYCLETDLRDETKKSIRDIVKEFHREIVFINIIQCCEENRFWNDKRDTMFARILIPILVNQGKVLYLDCDTLVLGSLDSLAQEEFDEAVCLVVQDTTRPDGRIESGLAENDRYFNSGVLYIDCNRWNSDKIFFKLKNYEELFSEEGHFPDQRPLNAVLSSKSKFIPVKYNVTSDYYTIKYAHLKKYVQTSKFYSKDEVMSAINNPFIVHFSGDEINRPWYRKSIHKEKDKFLYYMGLNKFTKFNAYEISGKTYIKQWLKLKCPIIVRYLINKIKQRKMNIDREKNI